MCSYYKFGVSKYRKTYLNKIYITNAITFIYFFTVVCGTTINKIDVLYT